ncbi:MAG: hypothetical protein E7429_00095 [Ruminococcaceae bacterium]|nr:hypothetical protein [Oscillospiraceae bacterium]
MTAKESARREWEKLKDRPMREKLHHLKTYYWGYFAAAAVILVGIGVLVYNHLTAKELALQGFFMHAVQNKVVAQEYEEGFAEFAGIDLNEFGFHMEANSDSVVGEPEASYTDGQIFTARLAGGELDVFGGDMTAMMTYAYGGYFSDLSQVATPEQMAAWEPYLLYMDRAVYEEIAQNTDIDAVYALPEPKEPETMKEPIPFGLHIPADSGLHEAYGFYCEDLVVGLAINVPRPAAAVAFLEYALR